MRGYCDKYLAMMKIQVVSSNGMLLSNGNSVCFNELGGNIGRADGNMLVLNDPTKTISVFMQLSLLGRDSILSKA